MKSQKPLVILRSAIGGFLALVWSWLIFVDVARMSSSPALGRLMAFFSYIVLVAISYGMFMFVAKKLLSYKVKRWYGLLWMILIWSFAEFFVSWFMAFIWYGKGGSLDSVLPFGSLTPLLMYTPFGFLSRLVGYHGLSAIFVVAGFIFARKDLQKYRLKYSAIILVLTILSWGLYARPNGKQIEATIVAEHLSEPQTVNVNKSQLVVLPEYGLEGYTSQTVSQRFNASHPLYFVGSHMVVEDDKVRNVLVFGNQNEYLLQKDKSRIIPAGEYLPYAFDYFLHATHNQEMLDTFQRRRAVEKGHEKLTPIKANDDLVLGSAVCSSIISTQDYRAMSKDGATILTNSASLEIFKGSRSFSIQHKGLAKFMAVANARSFLQASNNGTAFAIDHNGQVLASINPVNSAEVSVFTNTKITPYTYFGEWMAVLGGILVVWVGAKTAKTKYADMRTPKKQAHKSKIV